MQGKVHDSDGMPVSLIKTGSRHIIVMSMRPRASFGPWCTECYNEAVLLCLVSPFTCKKDEDALGKPTSTTGTCNSDQLSTNLRFWYL